MQNDKFKRIKYIRSLEKFALNITKSLKRADFSWEAFCQLRDKNYESLQKIEPVFLDEPYTRALESFANLAINATDKDFLLKSANALDKFRKAAKYKKDKHKGKFDEY